MSRRDFRGYGGRPPDPGWPDGARVAVSLVLNVEEGAERSLTMGDEVNQSVHEIEQEIVGRPDLCMESHFEYGTRAGYWRIVELLAAYGLSCTLNACARALELSPWLAADAIARGHEIGCHGWRWEGHAHLEREDERALIARALDAIERVAGVRPVGWHTRAPTATPHTRELLAEAGLLYDSDAYNDDLPYLVEAGGRPHVVLPYAFDTNDMRFQRGGGFVFGEDFARYCIDAFDRLWREGARTPKMMSIGLHLRIIGRPGRIAGLERVLEHIATRGGAWVACRAAIARHWRARAGLPDPTP